mmetsp:Transcript_36958/g.82170  ORF Transcript_36958/g.82170 Transcript_36958/m.82170 type:complete len:237 (-) Transcript_36958:529-1239(-)
MPRRLLLPPLAQAAHTSRVAGPASTSMLPMPSSSSSDSASPSTSLFAFSSASIFSASNRSSRSDTARAASLTVSLPLFFSMFFWHASHAMLSTSTPLFLSSVCVVSTYKGGATSFIFTGHSSVLVASAALMAALMCSMPSYAKQVSSTSARILTGWGVMRRLMFLRSWSLTSGVRQGRGPPCSSSKRLKIASPSSATMVLNASNACPKMRYSGHPSCLYSSSTSCPVSSLTCLIME